MHRVYRLRSRKEIEHLFRRGRRTEAALFRVVWQKNSLGHLRLALVAPRAVDRRSVLRNRLRRRTREWVRGREDVLGLPYDAAIIFKKQAAAVPRALFYEQLEQVFSQVAK